MKSIILMLLLAAGTAHAFDPWDTTDKAVGVAAATAFVIDWRQTQSIARDPQHWSELNPMLGQHPSVGAVNRHFAINGLLIGGTELSAHRSHVVAAL